MDVATIQAFGEYIVMPICFFGFMAYLVYCSHKDEIEDEENP
jgi:hypothetical protein